MAAPFATCWIWFDRADAVDAQRRGHPIPVRVMVHPRANDSTGACDLDAGNLYWCIAFKSGRDLAIRWQHNAADSEVRPGRRRVGFGW